MSESKKRMGRPPVNATPITVRIAPDLLEWLDSQREKLDPQPTRPEMVRTILQKVKDE